MKGLAATAGDGEVTLVWESVKNVTGYDEADQPLAFYNQFFKLWKSGTYSGYTYDERVALIASQVPTVTSPSSSPAGA